MLVKTWMDSDMQKSPAELATLTRMLILNGVFTILFNHSEDSTGTSSRNRADN